MRNRHCKYLKNDSRTSERKEVEKLYGEDSDDEEEEDDQKAYKKQLGGEGRQFSCCF